MNKNTQAANNSKIAMLFYLKMLILSTFALCSASFLARETSYDKGS
jgi:hypothetical protein